MVILPNFYTYAMACIVIVSKIIEVENALYYLLTEAGKIKNAFNQSFFPCSDLSGNRNSINVAITGSKIPIRNHFLGSLPILLASREVINGTLSIQSIPNDINKAAPIFTYVRIVIN
jgi:hypothetical protein